MSVNQVYNSPVQGTAAEIVMEGMSRLSETGDPELQPEINIHDDLTFVRVPKKRIDEVAEKVLNEMLDVPFDWVNVPITVEVSCGEDWESMEEIGDFSSDEWFG
jgi:DNA polymerase I-like protein with 3'-5' exonuclease and polymerase domains